MKSTIHLFLSVTILASFIGCLEDQCTETRTFIRYEPIYMSEEVLANSVVRSAARPLKNPGIIYFYKDMIMINEKGAGIHLYENSDPNSPQNVGFISIPGNHHFAIKDDHLQADHVGSLLTLDLRSLENPQVVSKIEGVFREPPYVEGLGYIVSYRATDQKQILDCSDPNFNSLRWNDNAGGFWGRPDFEATLDASSNSGSGGNVGTGGSTARFTIAGGHLYTVSSRDLKTYDLKDASKPKYLGAQNMGWGIETIFPFKDYLFIGSTSGMFIYDISAPASPSLQSSFAHVNACDPVVANDETAFVTLRDGTQCSGFANQLDVIDIQNVTDPFLIESYGMLNPHGLALDGKTLYVCEGDFGLRVLNVEKLKKVKTIKLYEDIRSTDVISLPNDILLVIGKDGFRQYDVSNSKKFKLLSTIPVQK